MTAVRTVPYWSGATIPTTSWRTKQVTPPDELPVSLAKAKANLRVTTDDDNALIMDLIRAATGYAEKYTRRACLRQTWDLYLDEFPDVIELPRPPLISVTSVKYLDGDNAEQTLSAPSYQVDIVTEPGQIVLAPSVSWPAQGTKVNGLVVRYICGYSDEAEFVPAAIKAAIQLHVQAHYDRDVAKMGEIIKRAEDLLRPFRSLRI